MVTFVETTHVSLEQISEILHKHTNFIIAGHIKPDGDAIGASMGLALSLAKMGKKPTVLLELYSNKYNIIPGRQFLLHDPPDDTDAEVFITLDCADAERLGAARSLLNTVPVTVCIDHHDTNTGFAQYNFIDADASSTSEIIFDLITPLVEMDVDIASAIYAGVVSDTGGFRFSATGKTTLENSARMMETGIPFTEIYSELMNRHSFDSAKALGIVIHNARQILGGRIVYSYITRNDLKSVGATPLDLDGVVEYLMSTRGAEVALFVYENERVPEVKISMRSHDFHVGHFAANWNGGGHRRAAGFTTTVPIMEILSVLLEELERELPAHA
jgi:phosphoesterase RecJ-like protein